MFKIANTKYSPKIVQPGGIEITIEINPLTGETKFRSSQPLDSLYVGRLFLDLSANVFAQMAKAQTIVVDSRDNVKTEVQS